MKRMKLTADEFRHAVYPAVAIMPAQSEAQARIIARVLLKLQREANVEPVSWEDVATGRVPMAEPLAPVTEIEMDPQEIECVLGQLRQFVTRVNSVASAAILDLHDRLKAESA